MKPKRKGKNGFPKRVKVSLMLDQDVLNALKGGADHYGTDVGSVISMIIRFGIFSKINIPKPEEVTHKIVMEKP